MKILVAPNAYKGSLSAHAAAEAIAGGVRTALPSAEVVTLPIADGGDGTSEVLRRALRGASREADAHDPLGRHVRASFTVIDGNAAALDVAAASGLAAIAPEERNPLEATSFGTGELLRQALAVGCRTILIGAGGSATVDGGAGILEALGVRLVDAAGRPVRRGGGSLEKIDRIDTSGIDPRVSAAEIVVMCDVDSDLLGPSGAARLFGPQKGASPHAVDLLETGLSHFADVILRDLGIDVRVVASAGAAGGIAAGLFAMLGARIVSGTDWVLDAIGFDAHLEGARLVITGEGRLDRQTLRNKAPYGAAVRARRRGVPTAAIVGSVDDASVDVRAIFDAVVEIASPPVTVEQAMRDARRLVQGAAQRVAEALVA